MYQNMTYPLPFQVYVESIYRLASIEFHPKRQEIYRAYEVHYVHDLNGVKGYLLYCRKKDGYFDLYMQNHLEVPLEKVKEIKEGILDVYPIEFDHILFEVREEQLFLSFQFLDKWNRVHSVELVEGTEQKTRPMDMLSPIGNKLREPTFFPLFFLYDFDFLRKRKARIKIEINHETFRSKDAIPTLFKDGTKRQLIKYAKSTQMIELFISSYTSLEEETMEDLKVVKNQVTYHFINDDTPELEKIEINSNPQGTNIVFHPAIPNIMNWNKTSLVGTICITGAHNAGRIEGEYRLKKTDKKVHLFIHLSKGYLKDKNTLLERLIFQKNASFSTWPKRYCYNSTIDLDTKRIYSKWTN